jgi:hypothetical protein
LAGIKRRGGKYQAFSNRRGEMREKREERRTTGEVQRTENRKPQQR